MEKKFEEMTNATNNGHSTPITTTKIKHPQLKPVDPLLPNFVHHKKLVYIRENFT
jgi:hypothetical protein